MESIAPQRWKGAAAGGVSGATKAPYLLFLIVGALWIILSDRMLLELKVSDDLVTMAGFQTTKGLLFVVLTAWTFYAIGRSRQQRLDQTAQELMSFSEIAKASYEIVWRFDVRNNELEILHLSDHERFASLQNEREKIIHPDDLGSGNLVDYIQRHGLTSPFKLSARLCIAGEYRHFEHWIFPVYDAHDELTEYYGTCRDIHDFIVGQERVSRDEHMLRMAADIGGVGIWEWDIPNNTLTMSEEVHRQYGIEIDSPTELKRYIHPDDYSVVREVMLAAKHQGMAFEIEYRVITADGQERWIHNKGAPQTNVNHKRGDVGSKMIGISLDVTRNKHSEQRLRQLAYYDSITELPNRMRGQQHLEHLYSGYTKCEGSPAVCLFDIDYFSSLNETYGPNIADAILQRLTERILGVTDAHDYVCRYGADVFLVIFTYQHEAQVEQKIKMLESILHAELSIAGMTLFVSMSAALATAATDGDSAAELLRAAQSALYNAKEQKRGRLVRFKPDILTKSLRFEAIRNALKTAIASAELDVKFQPLYHLQNESMHGFEALVRWHSASLGSVSPAEFIPIAERVGMIGEIDDFVLDSITEHIRQWESRGLDVGPIGFNLSPRNLEVDAGAVRLHEKIVSRGLAPGALLLEVTETAMIQDAVMVARNLEQLAVLGYMIAIDDFGTGYSSLENLHRFKIAKVKIDKSFTQAITISERHAGMVRSIISMAHAMTLEVVAEGVETEQQREYLTEWGCDIMQGYLYSRPVTAQEAEKFMRAT